MMHPITKSSRQIVGADFIPSAVREAFRIAEEERPGAVHIEFPEDIAEEPVSASALEHVEPRRPSPDPRAVEDAVRLINESKSPLVLIAAGANRKRVRGQLQEFVELTGIPFVTTQMGKGVLDERSPLCLGTAALMENDFPHLAIEGADLIISVGHDITEKPPAIMGYGRRKVIHINFYPAAVDDVYLPTHEVIGDIAHSIRALTDKLDSAHPWDFAFFKRVGAEFRSHLADKASDPSFPLKPQRIVTDLRAAMPDDGILALDNGMYKLWIARNYPAYAQNTVLLDNALATMGAGLPSAIAAKLVHPECKVMAVCGDGGFMMNSQELETAIRLGVELTVLIVNDSGYGMIKWKQDAMRLKSYALDFGNPDFVKYAESYGAKGYRVGSADELRGILDECLNSGGVNVVDCPVDYSENIRVFNEELPRILAAYKS
jgi:acetolactate synthase-1/2/3 large subunit